jgi:hypothetical protein
MSQLKDIWPSLPLEAWQDTCMTLHMWSQVVGKIRTKLTPVMNHWGQVIVRHNLSVFYFSNRPTMLPVINPDTILPILHQSNVDCLLV